MSRLFEELDYQPTEIGAISLRRRRDLVSGKDIFEVKLDEDFLMTSQVTASETALATQALQRIGPGSLSIVVGGLGLGYTAHAALCDDRVTEVLVIELLRPVIDWHRQGLVPLGDTLTTDARCTFRQGDFFALARSEEGFDPSEPRRRHDAILLDIDHAPGHVLHERSEGFYGAEGLGAVKRFLKPDGVFGLWSDERPDAAVIAHLQSVFTSAEAVPVTFPLPHQATLYIQTVYLASDRTLANDHAAPEDMNEGL